MSQKTDCERLGRWLFERDYRELGLCSAYDAPWDEWVERNQEEWCEEADSVLAFVLSLGWTPPADYRQETQP